MEASIHRRYRSIWCISSVKNPGQEEEEEAFHAANQCGAAHLARGSNSRGWRNRYFQRNSRPDVSFVVLQNLEKRSPTNTRTNETTFPFFRFSKTKFLANEWRQTRGAKWLADAATPSSCSANTRGFPPSQQLHSNLEPRVLILDNRLIMNTRLGVEFRNRFAKRCYNISCNNERIVPFANSNFHSPQFLSFVKNIHLLQNFVCVSNMWIFSGYANNCLRRYSFSPSEGKQDRLIYDARREIV